MKRAISKRQVIWNLNGIKALANSGIPGCSTDRAPQSPAILVLWRSEVEDWRLESQPGSDPAIQQARCDCTSSSKKVAFFKLFRIN